MNTTRGPIFKSIMLALAVIYIALISQSVWAAAHTPVQDSNEQISPG